MIVAATASNLENEFPWLRVVMADAEAASRRFYQESLAHEGFDVVTASNGIECLERLHECPPDALILDLNLPWGGAEGVLAIMAEEPDLASIPVLVHTFCRDPQVWQAIAKLHISDFHWKPAAAEMLGQRLRTLISNSRSQIAPSLASHHAVGQVSNLSGILR